MSPEQRPNQQQPHFPSLAQEFRRRMAELGVDNVKDVFIIETRRRYNAIKEVCSSREQFDAKFLANNGLGERWLFNRTRLGLDIDAVANQVGISPWEMMFLEMGLPSNDNILEEAREKLDVLYQRVNN